MNLKCELCPFEATSKEQFAGHRSGHVRKGDLKKREKRFIHNCEICKKNFKSGPALGGHQIIHNRNFETLRSDGGRKHRLIIERGHKCERCGNSSWMGNPIPLQLDHIDGDSDNGSKTNLRLLCPNCHAQTPTYGGRNIGRFPNALRYNAMREWKRKKSNRIFTVDEDLSQTTTDADSRKARYGSFQKG